MIIPEYICFPRTKKCKEYKNYLFYFIGFIKGIAISTIGAIPVSAILFAIVKAIITY